MSLKMNQSDRNYFMSFWTYFWIFVPPVILVSIGFVFYFTTGRKEEGQDK